MRFVKRFTNRYGTGLAVFLVAAVMLFADSSALGQNRALQRQQSMQGRLGFDTPGFATQFGGNATNRAYQRSQALLGRTQFNSPNFRFAPVCPNCSFIIAPNRAGLSRGLDGPKSRALSRLR